MRVHRSVERRLRFRHTMTHESAAGSTDQRNRDLTARSANVATLMHIPVIKAQSIGKSCVLGAVESPPSASLKRRSATITSTAPPVHRSAFWKDSTLHRPIGIK